MKLAVIETGFPPPELTDRFESYGRMFRDLLGEGFDWSRYDVQAGEWPDRPGAHDAYIITGSAAGVYDDEPWIAQLMDFLRAARGEAKLVGVCFGHQAMAAGLRRQGDQVAQGLGDRPARLSRGGPQSRG